MLAALLPNHLSAGLPLAMVNDRNKRGIHTVRGRLGSPRTPMIAFSSVIVTCLARSTAWATCCWCWGQGPSPITVKSSSGQDPLHLDSPGQAGRGAGPGPDCTYARPGPLCYQQHGTG